MSNGGLQFFREAHAKGATNDFMEIHKNVGVR